MSPHLIRRLGAPMRCMFSLGLCVQRTSTKQQLVAGPYLTTCWTCAFLVVCLAASACRYIFHSCRTDQKLSKHVANTRNAVVFPQLHSSSPTQRGTCLTRRRGWLSYNPFLCCKCPPTGELNTHGDLQHLAPRC